MRAIEILQYALPFFGALVGIFVFALERHELWKKIKGGEVGPITLALVSLLCIAYGIERVSYSQQVEERLDNISGLVQKFPNATFIDNNEQIWSTIEHMALNVEKNIWTVYAGDRPNIPEKYKDIPTKLAIRLSELKRNHPDVFYRIVLVFDEAITAKEAEDVMKNNNERLKMYEEKGLKGNVQLRVFPRKPLTKFDITIVDERHVMIGFDTLENSVNRGTVQIQNVMLWENQAALAGKLARWFETSVWQNATPYENWTPQTTSAPNSSSK
jgi:hypothetical protein